MPVFRPILVVGLIVAMVVPAASAQVPTRSAERPALNLTVPPELLIPASQQDPARRSLHPAAKGAILGGLVGAGAFGALGLWYCTVGPSEVGECGIKQWTPGLLVWGGVGTGAGAVIGALVGRR